MNDSRSWLARAACLAACVTVLSSVPVSRAEPVPCEADVSADFRREDTYDQYIDKIFTVNISSSEPCAKVYFDLTTTERLFNGEVITSTQREWRKVTGDPSKISPVKHRIARDSSLISWEVKYVRCVVCGTDAQ